MIKDTVRPVAVDDMICEGNLTLKDIRKALPKACVELSPARAWFTLARILGCIGLCIFLETKLEMREWWLLLPVWFLHGQSMVGLFVLAHDCGHDTFSSSKKMNLFIGHLAFAPLGNGMITWKLTHDHHHNHTQLKGQEVDWSKWLLTREEFQQTSWTKNFITRLGYRLPFGILTWVGWNAIKRGISRDHILGRPLSQSESRSVVLSNLFMLLMMTLIYVPLFYYAGMWALFKYHAIPATIAMVTGYLLLIVQHANPDSLWYETESWTSARGQMASTFDIRFPRFFEWLWLDINIHIPHHVAPFVPWYHLRKAQKALISAHPELYQERNFSLKEFNWMLRTPLIKRDGNRRTFSFATKTSEV